MLRPRRRRELARARERIRKPRRSELHHLVHHARRVRPARPSPARVALGLRGTPAAVEALRKASPRGAVHTPSRACAVGRSVVGTSGDVGGRCAGERRRTPGHHRELHNVVHRIVSEHHTAAAPVEGRGHWRETPPTQPGVDRGRCRALARAGLAGSRAGLGARARGRAGHGGSRSVTGLELCNPSSVLLGRASLAASSRAQEPSGREVAASCTRAE